MYSISQIASILSTRAILPNPGDVVEHLLTDSRRLFYAPTSLFFALKTTRSNGALFIDELYNRGVRNFVICHSTITDFPDANIIFVTDVLMALQQLASWHRNQFTIPVIGITGSNGKTMVKEWLYQLIQFDYNIVRSPKSYNSQVGVPLSVWQMNANHNLAIFEAGISQPGEMQYLQEIIKPTIGVLTNIGDAHSEGFNNLQQKVDEKLLLFKNATIFIYCKDCNEQMAVANIDETVFVKNGTDIYTWGTLAKADLTIEKTQVNNGTTSIFGTIVKTLTPVHINIPFTDKASIDNAITCWCVMIILGYEQSEIEKKMAILQPLDMRMQLKKGVNDCLIINDSYNNDLSSLELALDYLSQQSAGKKTTLILSDIFQSGLSPAELLKAVSKKVASRNLSRVIFVGPVFFANKDEFAAELNDEYGDRFLVEWFNATQAFLQQSNTHHFKNEVILLKGSRVFEFEQIVHWLQEKAHQTVLEVNLTAMVHNLKQYQKALQPGTRLMAMVKAFSYGSGSAEVAAVLQFHKVDYLAVAYADEGVELRKSGIHMPIMVMNPEIITFDLMIEHNLEPELYSPAILDAFNGYIIKLGIPQYPVHIKLDTGMHRLGFDSTQMDELLQALQNSPHLAIQSAFSHLAASENPEHDSFTRQQAVLFEDCCKKIEAAIGYSFIKHLSNTAAIFRHPGLQYNMVRLGIGLYGVDSAAQKQVGLLTVLTLKSTIAQIRKVKAGESVGYSRNTILKTDSTIATIRIGYADGYNRNLGNGVGKVWVKGRLAPLTGNVCMDMIMIDVTGIKDVKEGDEVEIFGKNLPVTQLAQWSQTIAYEVLTGISQRVKRVYFEE